MVVSEGCLPTTVEGDELRILLQYSTKRKVLDCPAGNKFMTAAAY